MMLTSPGQLRPLSSTARSAPIAPGIVSTTSPVTSGARFSTSRAWTQPFFIGSCQNSIELSGSTRSRQRNRYSRTASFMQVAGLKVIAADRADVPVELDVVELSDDDDRHSGFVEPLQRGFGRRQSGVHDDAEQIPAVVGQFEE